MSEKERVECYIGNYVLPFGQPVIFVSCSEVIDHVICERFIFFDLGNDLKKTGARIKFKTSDYQYFREIDNDDDIFDSLIMEEGLNLGEQDIMSILIEEFNEDKTRGQFLHQIRLRFNKGNILSSLFNIHNKYPEKLKWLKDSTMSETFKKWIYLAQGFNRITEHLK